jgi:heme/copper-type cytochrome/quinol oxidase subunit 2
MPNSSNAKNPNSKFTWRDLSIILGVLCVGLAIAGLYVLYKEYEYAKWVVLADAALFVMFLLCYYLKDRRTTAKETTTSEIKQLSILANVSSFIAAVLAIISSVISFSPKVTTNELNIGFYLVVIMAVCLAILFAVRTTKKLKPPTGTSEQQQSEENMENASNTGHENISKATPSMWFHYDNVAKCAKGRDESAKIATTTSKICITLLVILFIVVAFCFIASLMENSSLTITQSNFAEKILLFFVLTGIPLICIVVSVAISELLNNRFKKALSSEEEAEDKAGARVQTQTQGTTAQQGQPPIGFDTTNPANIGAGDEEPKTGKDEIEEIRADEHSDDPASNPPPPKSEAKDPRYFCLGFCNSQIA